LEYYSLFIENIIPYECVCVQNSKDKIKDQKTSLKAQTKLFAEYLHKKE